MTGIGPPVICPTLCDLTKCQRRRHFSRTYFDFGHINVLDVSPSIVIARHDFEPMSCKWVVKINVRRPWDYQRTIQPIDFNAPNNVTVDAEPQNTIFVPGTNNADWSRIWTVTYTLRVCDGAGHLNFKSSDAVGETNDILAKLNL